MRSIDRRMKRWRQERAEFERAKRHEFLCIWDHLSAALWNHKAPALLLLLVLNSQKPTIRRLWLRLQLGRWDSINPVPTDD